MGGCALPASDKYRYIVSSMISCHGMIASSRSRVFVIWLVMRRHDHADTTHDVPDGVLWYGCSMVDASIFLGLYRVNVVPTHVKMVCWSLTECIVFYYHIIILSHCMYVVAFSFVQVLSGKRESVSQENSRKWTSVKSCTERFSNLLPGMYTGRPGGVSGYPRAWYRSVS